MFSYLSYGIKPIINASETYTNLGGSVMNPETVQSMLDASQVFVDVNQLTSKLCQHIADITNNEAAFVTSGAAAGLVLSAAACASIGHESHNKRDLMRIDEKRKEVLMFDGLYTQLIPYWKQVKYAGVDIKFVSPNKNAIKEAVNENTVAFFLFPASLYERDLPKCEEIIPFLKSEKLNVVVDAAAQLPPSSNLWHYTKELGADLALFSGGKHIKGPQSTGLIVGNKKFVSTCRALASPNPLIGRPFKTSKEELVGFTVALEHFIKENEEERYLKQKKILLRIQNSLETAPGFTSKLSKEGRLGTYQPLLWLSLPKGLTGKQFNEFTRNRTPSVDVGYVDYDPIRDDDHIFINAYNLGDDEIEDVVNAINAIITMFQN